MSAIFKENIDGTFSLHFQKTELEALLVLLTVVDKNNPNGGPHAPAVQGLIDAIKLEIGSSRFNKIDNEVIITTVDTDDTWFIQFVNE